MQGPELATLAQTAAESLGICFRFKGVTTRSEILCTTSFGDLGLARTLSTLTNGTIFSSPISITLVKGKQVTMLVDAKAYPALAYSRSVIEELTSEACGLTIGAQARRVLKWLGGRRDASDYAKLALKECAWHYLRSRPGLSMKARLYDMDGAYYQLMRRMPTLGVRWLADGPVWSPCEDTVESRWCEALRALGPLKAVRNALVGAMIGGGASAFGWRNGEIVRLARNWGPFVDSGAMIVRTLAEVCELEAKHSNAVYANTDCVILDTEAEPCIWPELGLSWCEQARGTAHVVQINCWRVGRKATKPYKWGLRIEEADESPHLAQTGTWRWLGQTC